MSLDSLNSVSEEMDFDLDLSIEDAGTHPPYPAVEGSGDVVITRQRTFKAWSGRMDRLLKLSRNVESTLREAYESQLEGIPMDLAGQSQARRLRDELSMRCVVRGVDGVLSREGDLTAILGEMEYCDVKLVVLGNYPPSRSPRPRTMIQVVLGRTDLNLDTVRLTVKGADKRWVGGVYDNLSEELSKAVPALGLLRQRWVIKSIAAFLALGAFSALFAFVNDSGLTAGWLTLGILLVPTIAWTSQERLWRLIRWIVPAFELIEPGAPPKGARIGAAAALILSLLLSMAGVALGILSLN